MATLLKPNPKNNSLSSRKKAFPKQGAPIVASEDKKELPKNEEKETGWDSTYTPSDKEIVEFRKAQLASVELKPVKQGLKPWQSKPNDSMELIGCCSSHKECTEVGDCVEKAYHVNYEKTCSLYRNLKRRG